MTLACDFPPDARTRRVLSTSAMRPGLTPAEIDEVVRAKIAAGEELYRPDEGALRDLDPELVVTQDLCAVCAVDVSTVDAAMSYLGSDGPGLTLDPATLEDVVASISTIGAATGRPQEAARLTTELLGRLERVATTAAGRTLPRLVVLEWTDPPFSAGHWVPDIDRRGGRSLTPRSIRTTLGAHRLDGHRGRATGPDRRRAVRFPPNRCAPARG